MEIITKRLPELTDKEYRACHRLNLGLWGLMRETLEEESMAKNNDILVIMLWGRYMYGWALLQPTKQDQLAWVTPHAQRVSKYTAQFFVRESQRGRGYGKILMEETLKHDPKPFVLPHDDISASFFSNYRVTAERDRRIMINQSKKKKRKVA